MKIKIRRESGEVWEVQGWTIQEHPDEKWCPNCLVTYFTNTNTEYAEAWTPHKLHKYLGGGKFVTDVPKDILKASLELEGIG